MQRSSYGDPYTDQKAADIFSLGLLLLAMIQATSSTANEGLIPKVEYDELTKSEESTPIGKIIHQRLINKQVPLNIINPMITGSGVIHEIRSIILQATHYVPHHRISASYISRQLRTHLGATALASVGMTLPSPVLNSCDLCMDTDKPYPRKQLVQTDSFPTCMSSTGITQETNQSATNQFESRISDLDIMKISGLVPPSVLTRFAIRYLGTDIYEIDMARTMWREQIEMANFQILNKWVNQNPGVTRHQLYNLLMKASRDGLVDQKVFRHLVE